MTALAEQPVDAARRIEELGRIILAYSEVTERLEESHGKLQTQVNALREELGEKNRMLERRNRLAALGEMAAGMAHEIRNPLGGIQLYASLLARDLADRKASLQLVGKITAGVNRLESLVGQVLAFTREMTPNFAVEDLRDVIERAVEPVQDQMAGSGLRCTVDGPSRLRVRVDPLLLGQAVMNLVLNAAQATAGAGLVRVEFAGADGGSVRAFKQFRLAVRDNGPGIDPAVIDRIFNPFFTTRDTGTGLGLAIVHRIVEAHEGTIRACNAEGGGALFEILV
jgi:signal transduction histidine kinase